MDFALIWAIRFGLAALLVTPLIVSPSTIFPFIVGKAIFSRTIIEIVFALWLLLLIRRPEYRPARSVLAFLFGVYVVGALISGVFGVSFQRTFWSNYERMQGVYDLVHWFVALVILFTVIKGWVQWRLMLSLMMAVTLFITFLGLLQDLGIAWSAFAWLRGIEIDRIEISLGNATYVGSYGMVMVLLSLGLLLDTFIGTRPFSPTDQPLPEGSLRRRGRRRRPPARQSNVERELPIALLRLFYLAVLIGGVYMIAASGSRGAVFGLGLGLGAAGAAYIFWGDHSGLRRAAIGASVVLAVLVVAFLSLRSGTALEGLKSVAPIFDRSIGTTGLNNSARTRALATKSALVSFAKHPITGIGMENFATAWNRHQEEGAIVVPFAEFDQAHNKPAEVLATTGVVGYMGFSGFFGWAIFLGIRKIRSREISQPLDLFVFAGMVAFLGHLFFLFDTTSTVLLMILMAAYLASGEHAVAERARHHKPGDILVPPDAIVPEEPARPARRRQRRQARVATTSDESWQDIGLNFVAPIVIAVLLILSIGFTQVRPWQAARAVLQPGNPQEIADHAAVFTQLGTIPRQQFFRVMAEQMSQVPDEIVDDLLKVVESEIEIAIADEPENLKVRLAAAAFYRGAAFEYTGNRRAELVEAGREQSAEANRIAPHIFETRLDEIDAQFAEHYLGFNSFEDLEATVVQWREDDFWNPGLFENRLEDRRKQLAQAGQ